MIKPFIERRIHGRYAVSWNAVLHCSFDDNEETLPTEIIEVSIKGARILLPRMQVGSFHLGVDSGKHSLKMDIDLPEGLITSRVNIRWYKLHEPDRIFMLGVEFSKMSDGSYSLLKRKLMSL
jgi:hypothetical protein